MMVTRNQAIGAVSTVCQLPSFILTVVPTAAYDPGLAVCMAITVAMLPLVPFALRNVHDTAWKMLLVCLGAGLLLFNFTNALDALNGSHAAATNPVRAKMIAAEALDKKISELDVRKRQVEAHKTVSLESAQAAERAAAAECKVVGPKCRARQDELRDAQRDRKLTERAEDIEREMDKAKVDLAALGAVEKTDDRTSAQLASFFGLPSDVISTNRPVFRAFMVELLGGLGPFVLALVFGTAPETKRTEEDIKAEAVREHEAEKKRATRERKRERSTDMSTDVSRDRQTRQKAEEGREVSNNVVALPSKKSKRRKKE
jgi:hypothetical protein